MADDQLKLAALDTDDLAVISAHLQDAVMIVADMTWRPSEKRFAAVLSRFDWVHCVSRDKGPWRRRRTGLSFERVEAAQIRNIDTRTGDTVLSLLAIEFEPSDLPGGDVVLVFAGGGAIRLSVECIEARLSDLGPAWETSRRPGHEAALG
jgi:hypothetical protein